MNLPRSLGLWLLLTCAFALPALAQPSVGASGRVLGRSGGSSAADDALRRIVELQDGHTDRRDEARILELLRGLGAADFDAVVARLDLEDLFDDFDDRLIGPDHKSALYRLLSKERVADLSITSRARLIDALQEGDTERADERAAVDVFLATRGAPLRELKRAVDLGGDRRDLVQLVHGDIDSSARRRELQRHIAAHSGQTSQVKVLSDIDDTAYASLNDARYPRFTVYPGVRAFLSELDRGPDARPDALGDVGFLSARPDLIEDATHLQLELMGFAEGPLLEGSLEGVASHEAMADEKLAQFRRYRALYPEYGFVFVGDSGQGDAVFARAALGEGLDLALIHDVKGLDARSRAALAGAGVYVFDTYLGAAARAYERQRISRAGLVRVASAALRELRQIDFASDAQRDARWAELRADWSRAAQLLIR